MKISYIEASDRPEIQALYEHYLNSGPGMIPYFDCLFGVKKRIGLKSTQGGKIIASFLCSEGVSFTVPHPELLERVLTITGPEPVYTVDMIFTDPVHRHNGIQSILSTLVMEELSARGVRWLLVEHWIKTGQTEPDFGILRTNYIELGSFTEYYREIRNHGIVCPICGAFCSCGAKIILYRIKPVYAADHSEF